MLRGLVAALVFGITLASTTAGAQLALPGGSFQIAQSGSGSCSSWFNSCATRCRQRAPQDKNCVSDHCSPKLSVCRSTGCWQEGAQYGGGKHCGLKK